MNSEIVTSKNAMFISIEGKVSVNVREDIGETHVTIREDNYIPKRGDFVYIGNLPGLMDDSYLSIYDCEEDGFYRSIFEVNIKDEGVCFDVGLSSKRSIRKATSEECKVLFDKLKELGKKWNSDTKKIEDIYVPKDGDFVFFADDGRYRFSYLGIYKERDTVEYVAYCLVNTKPGSTLSNKRCSNDRSRCSNDRSIRLCTEEEKNQLLKVIDNAGKYWDDIAKELCDKPVVGDLCIFWNDYKSCAHIRILKLIREDNDSPYLALNSYYFKHCIKFESKEQYKKLINDTSNS